MAQAVPPTPVAFFVGVLACDADALGSACERLTTEWGNPWLDWGPRPFAFTHYYREESGPSLLRAFYAFSPLMPPDALAARKRRTNALEDELATHLSRPWPRPVNLDPGYVTPHNLVLASAKNYSHRIYLADGIYAEVTRLYQRKRFVNLPWTYPDYGSGDYDAFFHALRRSAPRPCPVGTEPPVQS